MEHGIKMALSFQRGEQEGFDYFFNDLYKQLLFYAWGFLKDEQRAKDALEQAFVNTWARREIFTHHLVVRDYLYVSVKNECIRYIKFEEFREIKKDKIASSEASWLTSEEADHTLIKSETRAIVHNWLSKLPKDCRTIMKLMYVDGLTAVEIASHLELNISTVKNQKARGLEIIKSIAAGKPVRRKDIIRPPSKIVILKESDKSVPEPKVGEKPKFILWRKKGRPKEEFKWSPSERNEKIYEAKEMGATFNDLSEMFNLSPATLVHIIREEKRSARIKELFLKNRRVSVVARITRITVRETIERLNYLFKINLYEDENRTCLATYKAIIKDYPHLQEKEGAGDIGCPETQYGLLA